jgi:molybdate transport system substrate-binding protein
MANASSSALKLLSTLAIAAPLRELVDRFRQTAGYALDIELGPTTVLVQRIASGVAADATVLTKEELDRLAGEGTVVRDSTIDLVRSFVGIAVKAGAPKPAIGTVDEFKTALRNARSIAYSRAGASGLFFAGLLQRLGMADEVNAKATIIPKGFTGELAASGAAELAIQQVSELMAVPGVDIVGRLPAEIGNEALFSAGIFAASARQADAARLLMFLSSADVAPVMRVYGLEPLHGV